jgi:hypothetical protein
VRILTSRKRAGLIMAKTVGDQFVETLAAVGVKRIYGIVGDSRLGAIHHAARGKSASPVDLASTVGE